jgi:hypothetical protein
VLELIDPGGQRRLTLAAVSRALGRAGVRPEVTRIASGPARLYALRNPERWAKATHAERVAGYSGSAAPKKPAKF